jgi:hypothetical protein
MIEEELKELNILANNIFDKTIRYIKEEIKEENIETLKNKIDFEKTCDFIRRSTSQTKAKWYVISSIISKICYNFRDEMENQESELFKKYLEKNND